MFMAAFVHFPVLLAPHGHQLGGEPVEPRRFKEAQAFLHLGAAGARSVITK
jgi:hypothetical protein